MATTVLVDANGQPFELVQAAALVRRVVISTAGVLTDSPVDVNTGFTNKINTITAVTVVLASGVGTKKLKFGGPAEQAIDVLQGEVRNGLAIRSGLYFTTDGAGGSITLEVHGRS